MIHPMQYVPGQTLRRRRDDRGLRCVTDATHETLLFDLDGTLTDAEALHFEAYRVLLDRFGIAITHADC